jgi:glycosyltransferase involved in cell wall biosynthesis
MEQRSVSVIIATYNRGSKIGRTLDSALAQTTPASQIVVVDDGSTDDTASWIQAHYPQVSLLSFPNGGTSLARNRGAAAATGQILVFLDHDDEMQPHALQSLTDLLTRFPEANAAYGDHTLRDLTTGEFFANHHEALPAFHRMRDIRPIAAEKDARVYGRPMHHALLRGNLLQQPWAIYRSAFAAVRGFDPDVRYCEDWDLFLRVSRQYKVAVTDQVIGHHYIEGQNLHRATGQEAQHMKVLRKHIRLCRWRDPRAEALLRHRLALYHKAAGDRCRGGDPAQAWREYIQSFFCWPFDMVVAVRCLAWSPSGILARSTPDE